MRTAVEYHANTVILLETKMLSVKCKKEDASSYKKNVLFFFSQKIIPKTVPLEPGPRTVLKARLSLPGLLPDVFSQGAEARVGKG